MKEKQETKIGAFFIEAQSFIDALDGIKDTRFYKREIKMLTNQLTNKLIIEYEKPLKHILSNDNAEISLNILRDLDKFKDLAAHERSLLVEMVNLYKTNPDFWQENITMYYEKLND
jgi:hypothetical protein